jgi:hypothetical protein
MAGTHERNLVLDHALLSEENLDIALTVGSIYDEICGRVRTDFTASLGTELTSRLGGGWQVTAEPVGEVVVVQLLGHPAEVYVALASDEGDRPRYPYLAVRCKNRDVLPADTADQLKAALDEQYGQGRSTVISLWWKSVDKRYADWGSHETLVQLYRKGEALVYFVGHLEKVATVIQAVLRPQPSVKSRK